MDKTIETHTVDVTLDELIDRIYSHPPLDPFSMDLEILTGQDIVSFLGKFIMMGCKILYKRELAQLSADEVSNLRKYLWSIGWDAEYNPVKKEKMVIDYLPDGRPYQKSIPYTDWKIYFKPASRSLDMKHTHQTGNQC